MRYATIECTGKARIHDEKDVPGGQIAQDDLQATVRHIGGVPRIVLCPQGIPAHQESFLCRLDKVTVPGDKNEQLVGGTERRILLGIFHQNAKDLFRGGIRYESRFESVGLLELLSHGLRVDYRIDETWPVVIFASREENGVVFPWSERGGRA